MKGIFWMIIFVLFNSLPNRLCLDFSTGNAIYFCHIVFRHHPWIQENPAIKNSELKCWTIPNIGQSGAKQCVLNTLNTTQHYVHFTSRKCDISRGKIDEFDLHCILPNEGSRYLSHYQRIKFGKLRKIFPSGVVVYFINSTALNGDRTNIISNAWTPTKSRHSIAFICTKQNGLLARERGDVQLRAGEREADETHHRKRRHIPTRNYTTSSAFSSYFPKITITSYPVTPPLMPSSRNLIVPSRTRTDVLDLCPRSVVVNRSTIYVTPTKVRTGHAMSLIPTSKLTPVTHFTVSSMLRKSLAVTDTLVLPSAITSTTSCILAHLEKRTKNATYIYNDRLVSVVHYAKSSAYIISLSCATVAQRLLIPTATQEPLCSSASNGGPTSETDDIATKAERLHLGLIVAGGVVLTLMFCIAMFLLVRRYRRIQALRRKAKQISYFNRFDCSSAWDEPDFGGSKLSVFTLKNSKFDIDWETTHDTKQ